MIAYDPARPLISIHIPKTGGTSFRRNLEAWFGRRLYLHYEDEQRHLKPPRIRLRKRFGRGWRGGLCIHGHFNMNAGLGIPAYYPEVKQFITWVRDPLEMQVSLYSHQLRVLGGALYRDAGGAMVKTDDLDEFLEQSRCTYFNYFPEPVDGADPQDQLDRLFVHVGVLENAERSMELMAEKLGRRVVHVFHENTSRRPRQPSESSASRFRAKSGPEYRFYEWACRQNR